MSLYLYECKLIKFVFNLIGVSGCNADTPNLGHGNFGPSFEFNTVWRTANTMNYPDNCVHKLLKQS